MNGQEIFINKPLDKYPKSDYTTIVRFRIQYLWRNDYDRKN